MLCDKHINYEKYFKTFIAGNNAPLSYLQNTILSWLEQSIFSYNLVVTVEICFEATLIHGQLPSELIFAQSVLRKMRFSSLAYGVVCIKKRLT